MIARSSQPEANPLPDPIRLSKVLVVEGRDDAEFCEALLRDLGLSEQIEIRTAKGKHSLHDFLEPFVIESGFRKQVISLGIICDADRNAQAAFESVCNTLRSLDLSVPGRMATQSRGKPRVSIYIFPNCQDMGALEDLCLQTVADDPAMPCVEQYFQCLQSAGTSLPADLRKAKVRTYIASKPEPTLPLGLAAHRAYWNWTSPALNPLKQFLHAL